MHSQSEQAGKPPKLKNVEINPGRLCNNKCIFCMSGEERDDHEPWADPARMKAEIEMRYKEGAQSLGFLGGEPSTYPHIVECMRFAKELGYIRIALCTNAVRLGNPDFLDQCIAAGLSRVTISVHSHIPSIEEFLVGVPGILDRKIQAIDNLVERQKRGLLPHGVSLNPVFCRQNAPHAVEFVKFFMAHGVQDFRFNFIWPESRVLNDKTVIPTFTDVMPHVLNLILKNEREFRTHINFGAIPYCVLPAFMHDNWPLLNKYFNEEGNDLPTDVSFLRPDAVGTVERFNWQKRGHDDYRTKVEACKDCRFDPVCMGIYRSYLPLYGEGEFVASKASK